MILAVSDGRSVNMSNGTLPESKQPLCQKFHG
jgi:hypothetical protein